MWATQAATKKGTPDAQLALQAVPAARGQARLAQDVLDGRRTALSNEHPPQNPPAQDMVQIPEFYAGGKIALAGDHNALALEAAEVAPPIFVLRSQEKQKQIRLAGIREILPVYHDGGVDSEMARVIRECLREKDLPVRASDADHPELIDIFREQAENNPQVQPPYQHRDFRFSAKQAVFELAARRQARAELAVESTSSDATQVPKRLQRRKAVISDAPSPPASSALPQQKDERPAISMQQAAIDLRAQLSICRVAITNSMAMSKSRDARFRLKNDLSLINGMEKRLDNRDWVVFTRGPQPLYEATLNYNFAKNNWNSEV